VVGSSHFYDAYCAVCFSSKSCAMERDDGVCDEFKEAFAAKSARSGGHIKGGLSVEFCGHDDCAIELFEESGEFVKFGS